MESFDYEKHPWWEDAKQDAYLLMLEKGLEFADSDQQEKWLYVTAKNILKNIINKNSNCTCFSSMRSSCVSDFNPNPELFNKNLYSILEETITTNQIFRVLSDTDKLFFRLRYYIGYSYDELGELFGINPANARKRYERIKLKIRCYFPYFLKMAA
jgi:RNA polymerase sigma factor (sigma-70 family)